MVAYNKLKATIIVTVFAFLQGCSDSDRADKIVDSAKKKNDEAVSLYSRTEKRSKETLSPKGNTIAELQTYKATVIGEARSIADDYQKVSDMLKDVAKEYEDVWRMNLNSEHKEFAKTKSDEYNKRSEAVAAVRDGVQAFIETDDYNKLHVKLVEYEEKQHQLFKEAEDLASKANMIRHKSEPLIMW